MITFAEHQRAYFESLDWSLNDRSLSLLTGAPSHEIATWRVALQKPGAADSAALAAVTNGYVRQRNNRFGIDWQSVDWTKRNVDIARELGVTQGSVCQNRKRLGIPGITKHSETFRNVDWSKNDQELSVELRLDPGIVSKWRHKLDQPVATHYKQREGARVTPDDIANADWARFTDAELSRQFGVGRERIRQIRQKNNLPRCKFRNLKQSDATVLRWIDDHRAELEGKTIKEAAAVIPSDRDVTVKQRWLTNCDIKTIPASERERTPSPYGPKWLPNVDWNIPNCVLIFPWRKKTFFFATHRYRLLKPKAAWHPGGAFSTLFKEKDFLDAVRSQFEAARQAGIDPDEKGYKQWLKYRKETNERAQAR